MESTCLEVPDKLASRGVEIDNEPAEQSPEQKRGIGHNNTHPRSNTGAAALYNSLLKEKDFAKHFGIQPREELGSESFLEQTLPKDRYS